MGKQTTVTCDSCEIDIYGKKYFTLNIRRVAQGKQTINPVVYLCPKCFRETKLAMLLLDSREVEE